jgi:hypothetical protein
MLIYAKSFKILCSSCNVFITRIFPAIIDRCLWLGKKLVVVGNQFDWIGDLVSEVVGVEKIESENKCNVGVDVGNRSVVGDFLVENGDRSANDINYESRKFRDFDGFDGMDVFMVAN